MQGLFSAVALLGVAIIGLMVMVGKLTPADAIGRIAWLIVMLISADISLAMLERFVIVPLITAARQFLPIALTILCVSAGLLVLVLVAGALIRRLRNRSPRQFE